MASTGRTRPLPAASTAARAAFAELSQLSTYCRDQLSEKLAVLTNGLSTKVPVVCSTKVPVVCSTKVPVDKSLIHRVSP